MLQPADQTELTDYPTQKPEALIERVIRASTNPGDLVFDSFMGSGTTQAVALKLGRRFIGADINLGAIEVAKTRFIGIADEVGDGKSYVPNIKNGLDDYTETSLFDGDAEEDGGVNIDRWYTGFEFYNVNYYDVFRNPVQAKELLVEALEIQPLMSASAGVYDGEKDGRMVKIMPINRIATRADLNELIAGVDYKTFQRRQAESPTRPVEKFLLVCMGHEPDLAAHLKTELHPFKIDVEVVDILRNESRLEFKRPSEALLAVKKGSLVIERFYPMNLLQKLSLMKEDVKDWRELVESVLVDWNYDGAVLTPSIVDVPSDGEVVSGSYPIPKEAGTVRVKITDLLSESWEGEIQHG
jgi:adenine-specific DNA-methyltransferase